MRLEDTAMIPKYPSQVKRVGHESNYYHTKNHQILKLLAIWLRATILKILQKIMKMFEYGKFLKSNVLVSFYKPLPNQWLAVLSIWLFERCGCSFSDLKTLQNANFKNFCIATFFPPVQVFSFPLHSYHNLLYSSIGWLSRLNYATLRTVDLPYGYSCQGLRDFTRQICMQICYLPKSF